MKVTVVQKEKQNRCVPSQQLMCAALCMTHNKYVYTSESWPVKSSTSLPASMLAKRRGKSIKRLQTRNEALHCSRQNIWVMHSSTLADAQLLGKKTNQIRCIYSVGPLKLSAPHLSLYFLPATCCSVPVRSGFLIFLMNTGDIQQDITLMMLLQMRNSCCQSFTYSV